MPETEKAPYWYSPSERRVGMTSWGKKKRARDAVDLTADEHAALFPAGEPTREIETGPDGKPRWRMASIDDQRADAIFAVKAEAKRRIEAVLPLHKQLNALRLDHLSAENCEAFATIDAIRAASNLIEQDIAESEKPLAVPIKDHPAWPEIWGPETAK